MAFTNRETARSAIKLSVVKGRHAGAVQMLDGTPVILGSSADSDTVITDDGVASEHVRFDFDKKQVRVTKLSGDDISINGKAFAQTTTRIDLPVLITIGEADIRLDREAGQKNTLRLIGNPVVAFLIVGLFYVLQLHDKFGLVKQSAPQDQQQSIAQPVKFERDSEIKQAADKLRGRLWRIGLQTVQIKAGVDAVLASGTVELTRKADWESTQVWFDQQGVSVALRSDVVIGEKDEKKAPITLQSVWAGTQPYIIDGQGKKIFEGSYIKDGWILEKVENGRVLVRQNNEVVSIKF